MLRSFVVGRAALAIAIAWCILLVTAGARADVDLPGSDVNHAAMFDGLDRFPEVRFFVVWPQGAVRRVKTGEPVGSLRSLPHFALWAVRGATPDDASITEAWLRSALKNDTTSLVARATLDGYASLKDKPETTHLLTVYGLKAVDGPRIALVRERVESYESPAGYMKNEDPWAWYVRASAAAQLPAPASIEPGAGGPRATRWWWLAGGVGAVVSAAALLWRARRAR